MTRIQDFTNVQEEFVARVSGRGSTFIIGVAGDSGSGKTTFTQSLRHLFGDSLVSTITLDDYHLYDREERKIRNVTPLDPDANDLGKLEEDLSALKSGSSVRKMVYNHEKGTLEGPVEFRPTPLLIIEGLHPLFTPALRKITDFAIFVDPEPEVKKEWKIKRDTGRRGYTEREVVEQMRRRETDYLRFIAPQKEMADAVIRIAFSRYGRDLGWSRNIYRTTILQVPPEWGSDDHRLMMDIFPILTLHASEFSLDYARETIGTRMMSALTFDGCYDHRFLLGIERSFRSETGIDPAEILGKEALCPTEVVQVLLCWRVLQDMTRRR